MNYGSYWVYKPMVQFQYPTTMPIPTMMSIPAIQQLRRDLTQFNQNFLQLDPSMLANSVEDFLSYPHLDTKTEQTFPEPTVQALPKITGNNKSTGPQKNALALSLENVNHNDVDQGKEGDCVFEAALASVALRNKDLIRNMIKDNGNKTYTVTFPGEADKPVTVSDDGLQQGSSRNRNGWAKIIETAFIKSHPEMAQAKFPDTLNGKPATPAQQMLYLLTGKEATKIEATAQDIGTTLDKEVNQNKKPAIAFCADNADNALHDHHEWTITKYDAASQTVTVRNPWGHGTIQPGETKNGITGLDNGQAQMSLATFSKYFKEVTFV